MVERATQLKAGYVRSARGTGEGEMFAALEVMGPLFGRGRARGEEGGVCDRETGSYVHTSKWIRDLAADTPTFATQPFFSRSIAPKACTIAREPQTLTSKTRFASARSASSRGVT